MKKIKILLFLVALLAIGFFIGLPYLSSTAEDTNYDFPVFNRAVIQCSNPNLEEAKVPVADVHRPALQLHGFYEHFEPSRIQVIGNVETAYLAKKSNEDKAAAFAKLFSYEIPCVIYCRG